MRLRSVLGTFVTDTFGGAARRLLAVALLAAAGVAGVKGATMQSAGDMLEASKAGDVKRVRELMRSNPSLVNAEAEGGETPILAALFRGHKEVVEALLEGGARLNLFEAAALGKAGRVEEILSESPRLINSKGFGRATALHFAAFTGRREVVALLLRRGAQVNVTAEGIDDVTPLHSAAAGGHAEIVGLLLAAGARPDARQKGGFVPLHEAAMKGRLAMVETLLRYGADANAADDKGTTPLAYALKGGHTEVADALRRGGAKN